MLSDVVPESSVVVKVTVVGPCELVNMVSVLALVTVSFSSVGELAVTVAVADDGGL